MNNQAQATKDIGFDLDSLLAPEEITHKCGVIFDEEGEAISGFYIVGKNSEQYRTGQKKLRVEGIQRNAKRKKALDTTTEAGAEFVADAVEKNDLRTAQSVVVGWFGFTQGGKEREFDKGIADLLLERKPSYRDRILADLDADANFMPS